MITLFLSLLVSYSYAFDVRSPYPFDWQSHRGARGLYPENTIGAMKEAMKHPHVTTLEMDAIISKDGLAVVSHEPWLEGEICLKLDGTSPQGKEINLYKLTAKEIAQFDCGSKKHPRFPEQKKIKEHKPLLLDLLKTIQKTFNDQVRNTSFSIEIKSTLEEEKAGYQPGYKEFTDIVVETYKKSPEPRSRLVLQSFDWRVIDYIHEKHPEYPTVALIEVEYDYKSILKQLKKKPDIFSPNFKMLTKDQINYFHSQGVKVIPWTVNTTLEMNKLIDIGVDGIITDYPNLIPVRNTKITK